MTNPEAIIEAAARALPNWDQDDARRVASIILTAVTPLIRAQVLEEAAKVAEGFLWKGDPNWVADAIRALKGQQQADALDRHTLMGPPSDFNEL